MNFLIIVGNILKTESVKFTEKFENNFFLQNCIENCLAPVMNFKKSYQNDRKRKIRGIIVFNIIFKKYKKTILEALDT